jgi:Pyridine nucleotide-disulphide oxidoreductase
LLVRPRSSPPDSSRVTHPLSAGYVGLELAQAYRRFGSRATVIETGPQIVSREDPDIAEAIHGILSEEGVQFVLSAKPVAVQGRSIEKGYKTTVDCQMKRHMRRKLSLTAIFCPRCAFGEARTTPLRSLSLAVAEPKSSPNRVTQWPAARLLLYVPNDPSIEGDGFGAEGKGAVDCGDENLRCAQ